jgi:hypothetical protein
LSAYWARSFTSQIPLTGTSSCPGNLQGFAVDACLSGHVSRAFVKAAIVVAAEDERLKDITDGAGKAITDQ